MAPLPLKLDPERIKETGDAEKKRVLSTVMSMLRPTVMVEKSTISDEAVKTGVMMQAGLQLGGVAPTIE
jgi:hypothetical protein